MSNENFEFVVNHRHFVTSIVSILDLIKLKVSNIDDPKMKTKYKERLVKSCDKVLDSYRKENSSFDEGKIIKKIYKIVKKNVNLIDEKNGELFTLKDDENRIITLIPGIDIGLVYNYFDENELISFWQYMYLMLLSSIKMINQANTENKKENDAINELLKKMEIDITKTGVTVNGMMFNPFVGIGQENNSYSINELYTEEMKGIDNSKVPSVGIDMVLQSLGVDKMLNMDKLNDQLKNISENDVKEATKNITELLGAQDESVKGVCDKLVKSIVKNLKKNGLTNMVDTLQAVTSEIEHDMDKDAMQKTANQMNFFMQNSESRLRNMKDENGNNIGEKLYEKMGNPLEMAKNMTNMNIDELQKKMEETKQNIESKVKVENKVEEL